MLHRSAPLVAHKKLILADLTDLPGKRRIRAHSFKVRLPVLRENLPETGSHLVNFLTLVEN